MLYVLILIALTDKSSPFVDADRHYLIGNVDHGIRKPIVERFFPADEQKPKHNRNVHKVRRKNISLNTWRRTDPMIKGERVMYEVPLLEKKDIMGIQEQRNNGSAVPVLPDVSNLFGKGEKAMSSLLRTLKGSSKDEVSEGRFLNLFEVVNFNNVECVSGTGVSGVCIHEIECASASGVQVGSCADGYGVCCKCESYFICILFKYIPRRTDNDRARV